MQNSVSDVVISQIQAIAEDVQPLLAEVHDSGLLKEVENLTKSLSRASDDLRQTIFMFAVQFQVDLKQKGYFNLE